MFAGDKLRGLQRLIHMRGLRNARAVVPSWRFDPLHMKSGIYRDPKVSLIAYFAIGACTAFHRWCAMWLGGPLY